MKKILYIGIIAILVSSCSALQTPDTPKLTALQTVNGYTQTDNFVYVYNLSLVNLTWDVSMVPDAVGVEIIIARDTSCKTVSASVESNIIDSATAATIYGYSTGSWNPFENLGTLFSSKLDKISAGINYVCIKSISSSGGRSGASYPVTVSILY